MTLSTFFTYKSLGSYPVQSEGKRAILSDHVRKALLTLSEYDIYAAFDEAGDFIGIGYTGTGGRFTKFANDKEAKAVEVLECEYRLELIKELRG